VIVGGGMSMDAGGGVCQVSSTLYNAALRAGMEIIERHPHSIRIHYVPPGQDAAVAYNYLDLQFRNNYTTPVLIKSYVSGRRIVMSVLGCRTSAGQ
jgi:vancomycin resistance protein YoaR